MIFFCFLGEAQEPDVGQHHAASSQFTACTSTSQVAGRPPSAGGTTGTSKVSQTSPGVVLEGRGRHLWVAGRPQSPTKAISSKMHYIWLKKKH